MVAEDRATVDVDDHEQPDPLDLELLLEAERISNNNLQSDVEPVAIELDDFQGCGGRRGCVSGHALDVLGAGKPRAAVEVAQALGAYSHRERSDSHPLGVERVVGAAQPEGAALLQELHVQRVQVPQAGLEPVVRAC